MRRGQHEFAQLGCLIQPVIKGDRRLYFPQTALELLRIIIGIHRVDAIDQQRTDLSVIHIRHQPGDVTVDPLAHLYGRSPVDRSAIGADRLVDRIDDDLDMHIVAAADDERLAFIVHQIFCRFFYPGL